MIHYQQDGEMDGLHDRSAEDGAEAGGSSRAGGLLLQVEDLKIRFRNREHVHEAVSGVSFDVVSGETVAIVGESGSGKSVTAMALAGLLPPAPSCDVSGRVLYQGQDVLQMRGSRLRRLRGGQIAYVFQEPSSCLHPTYPVGRQIAEAVRIHQPACADVRAEVVQALDAVGIRDPEQRMGDYPFQLSGGMQQRVMIAMALACKPKLLVADEPTTALDVTIQAQILDLLRMVKDRTGMAVLMITHNFGIVDGFANRLLVMHRGRIVERGEVATVLRHPSHPYTQALIRCIPRLGARRKRLETSNVFSF